MSEQLQLLEDDIKNKLKQFRYQKEEETKKQEEEKSSFHKEISSTLFQGVVASFLQNQEDALTYFYKQYSRKRAFLCFGICSSNPEDHYEIERRISYSIDIGIDRHKLWRYQIDIKTLENQLKQYFENEKYFSCKRVEYSNFYEIIITIIATKKLIKMIEEES